MTAKLSVVLKADDKIVIESDDAKIWQVAMNLILGGDSTQIVAASEVAHTGPAVREATAPHRPNSDPLTRFAQSLGVSNEVVEGALSPSIEAPYLHLNAHNWEAFKKGNPKRGTGAITPIQAAATLLALWFREAKIDVPLKRVLADAVLSTINITDTNADRGLKNADWLQKRAGGFFVLNPAEISQAQKIARAFCEKRGVEKSPE